MKVINLWAGPGAGKSTTAAGLFYKMKFAGKKVELVTEFAKELVYENTPTLTNNFFLIAEQDKRLRRLIGQVDYVITDCPLPLNILYSKPPFDGDWYKKMAWHVFNTYDNFNAVVQRVKPYAKYGRYQEEDEAKEIDRRVRELLDQNHIPHVAVPGDESAPGLLARMIEEQE